MAKVQMPLWAKRIPEVKCIAEQDEHFRYRLWFCTSPNERHAQVLIREAKARTRGMPLVGMENLPIEEMDIEPPSDPETEQGQEMEKAVPVPANSLCTSSSSVEQSGSIIVVEKETK